MLTNGVLFRSDGSLGRQSLRYHQQERTYLKFKTCRGICPLYVISVIHNNFKTEARCSRSPNPTTLTQNDQKLITVGENDIEITQYNFHEKILKGTKPWS